jgi:hypothetical protein
MIGGGTGCSGTSTNSPFGEPGDDVFQHPVRLRAAAERQDGELQQAPG